MKTLPLLLAGLLAASSANAAPVAIYKRLNSDDSIFYVILTDEPATNTGCDDGPHVKLAKVSPGGSRNDIGPLHDGCWVSDGSSEVSVIALPSSDFEGGMGTLRPSDFQKTQAFKTWVYQADGTAPISYRQ